jgi:glycosyltransferase involved in cell wall biosynthesis
MQRARAFVYAAEEDFGIVTVEAQACGTPVIAFGKGGSLETVIEDKTGIFFHEHTIAGLQAAVRRFENIEDRFSPQELERNSKRFGQERFKLEFKEFIDRAMAHRYSSPDY